MADIGKFLFLRHLRANPTAHVRHLRNGAVVHDGAGQAFWFRPLAAALSEVPVDRHDRNVNVIVTEHGCVEVTPVPGATPQAAPAGGPACPT